MISSLKHIVSNLVALPTTGRWKKKVLMTNYVVILQLLEKSWSFEKLQLSFLTSVKIFFCLCFFPLWCLGFFYCEVSIPKMHFVSPTSVRMAAFIKFFLQRALETPRPRVPRPCLLPHPWSFSLSLFCSPPAFLFLSPPFCTLSV